MEKLSPILEQQVFDLRGDTHPLLNELVNISWAAVFPIVYADGAQDELEGQGTVISTGSSTLDGQSEEAAPDGVLVGRKVVVR